MRRARSPRPTVSSSAPGRSGRSSSACPRASLPPPRATRRSAARRNSTRSRARSCVPPDAWASGRRCSTGCSPMRPGTLEGRRHDAVDDPARAPPTRRSRRRGAGGRARSAGRARRRRRLRAPRRHARAAALRVVRLRLRPRDLLAVRVAARPPGRAVQHDQPPDAARRPRPSRESRSSPRSGRSARRAGCSWCRPSRSPRPRRSGMLAREHGAGWVAAVPAILWCASPVVLRPALHDFHPRRSCRCSSSAAASFSRGARRVVPRHGRERVRDEGGRRPHVRRAGLVLAWSGRRRLGAGLAVGSVAWSAIAVFVVLPAFGTLRRTSSARASRAYRRLVRGRARVHGSEPADDGRPGPRSRRSGSSPCSSSRRVGCACSRRLAAGRGPAALSPALLLTSSTRSSTTTGSSPRGPWRSRARSARRPRPCGSTRTWLAWGAAAGCLLVLLSAQWVGAIGRQIRFEWPHRGDRQAILDAIPDGARVAAPMRALASLGADAPLRAPRAAHPRPRRDGVGPRARARATRELEYIVFDPAMRFWGAPTVEQVNRRSSAAAFREVMRPGRNAAVPPGAQVVDPSVVALIGARSGSERVPRREHPAPRRPPAPGLRGRDRPPVGSLRARRRLDRQRGDREDRALVRRRRPVPPPRGVRDSDVAEHRMDRLDAAPRLGERYDLFAIVRATNPFRGPGVIRRGLERLLATPEADSIHGRAWRSSTRGRCRS